MTTPEDIDLSALPPALRAAFEAERAARLALEAEVSALTERNRRLDHLVQELRQAVYGKRSEKLTADERQLSFEDLETAEQEWQRSERRRSAPNGVSRRAARPERGAVRWPGHVLQRSGPASRSGLSAAQ